MPRGRLPKPDAVKRAAGNPGKRRLAPAPKRTAIRATVAGGVVPPSYLDAEAKRIWNRLVPDLQRLNFMRSSDSDALARYCDHVSGWARARKTIRREGEFYDATSVTGEALKRLHPAVKVAEIHEKHLVELEDRFGLSPLARQRILRDQAALPPGMLPLGAPADSSPAQAKRDPADPVTPEPPPAASPVGLLSRPAQGHA